MTCVRREEDVLDDGRDSAQDLDELGARDVRLIRWCNRKGPPWALPLAIIAAWSRRRPGAQEVRECFCYGRVGLERVRNRDPERAKGRESGERNANTPPRERVDERGRCGQGEEGRTVNVEMREGAGGCERRQEAFCTMDIEV